MRQLTREELTAATAARQMLIERQPLAPTEAIRRLTPLQGQHPTAPFVALAARTEGFERSGLEASIDAGEVVKSSIMRVTLHVAAASEYPEFAQHARRGRMRKWRQVYAHLDEEKVVSELTDWFSEPRTNNEIRERVGRYEGVSAEGWSPIVFARLLLPLIHVPPAGHWKSPRQPLSTLDPRPRPDPADAATVVLTRYLEAFGPASRRDLAFWSGGGAGEFSDAYERVPTVSYRDEKGTELLDLANRPLPPASTPLPPRFLGRWDQVLLAYADRDRIIPPELLGLKLTLSGDQTLTVEGRVAASWKMDKTRLVITPHTDIARWAHAAIREEGMRTARLFAPDADDHEVTGL